ncbi:C-terminal binding protein [Planctomycetota bacterium]
MKVVVTDYIEDNLDWEAEKLSASGIDFETCQLKFKPAEEVLQKIADADVIVVNMVKMDENIISKLKNCKVIIRHGVGYDNVDVDACTRHGIVFAYQPSYCMEDVAEHAMMLILACARKLIQGRKILQESSERGAWDFSELFPIHRMSGKTLGVVGTGRIGSVVCRRMKGFGFRVIACDPYLPEEQKTELGVDFVDLETLLRDSDFVSIHTPLNNETKDIIGAEALGVMKPTAYLINTARGPLTDVDALAEALKSGKIAGAAIDVYGLEPPPPSFPLLGMDNVILTPHMAWASEEAGREIRERIVDDILRHAKGEAPLYVVNKEVLGE